jgi:hypothetical protein
MWPDRSIPFQRPLQDRQHWGILLRRFDVDGDTMTALRCTIAVCTLALFAGCGASTQQDSVVLTQSHRLSLQQDDAVTSQGHEQVPTVQYLPGTSIEIEPASQADKQRAIDSRQAASKSLEVRPVDVGETFGQTLLVHYSNFGSGKVDQQGRLTPNYVNRLAWLVHRTNVPLIPAGPPGSSSNTKPLRCESYIAIDALSGAYLEEVQTCENFAEGPADRGN